AGVKRPGVPGAVPTAGPPACTATERPEPDSMVTAGTVPRALMKSATRMSPPAALAARPEGTARQKTRSGRISQPMVAGTIRFLVMMRQRPPECGIVQPLDSRRSRKLCPKPGIGLRRTGVWRRRAGGVAPARRSSGRCVCPPWMRALRRPPGCADSAFRRLDSQVPERRRRRHPSAGGALQKSDLDQVRLVHVFDRPAFFADGGGDRVEPDRSAAEMPDDRRQQLVVDGIKAEGVHLKALEGFR